MKILKISKKCTILWFSIVRTWQECLDRKKQTWFLHIFEVALLWLLACLWASSPQVGYFIVPVCGIIARLWDTSSPSDGHEWGQSSDWCLLQAMYLSKSGFDNYPEADACYKVYIPVTLGLRPTLKLTLVTSYVFKQIWVWELPWSWRLWQGINLIYSGCETDPQADACYKVWI